MWSFSAHLFFPEIYKAFDEIFIVLVGTEYSLMLRAPKTFPITLLLCHCESKLLPQIEFSKYQITIYFLVILWDSKTYYFASKKLNIGSGYLAFDVIKFQTDLSEVFGVLWDKHYLWYFSEHVFPKSIWPNSFLASWSTDTQSCSIN